MSKRNLTTHTGRYNVVELRCVNCKRRLGFLRFGGFINADGLGQDYPCITTLDVRADSKHTCIAVVCKHCLDNNKDISYLASISDNQPVDTQLSDDFVSVLTIKR